MTTIPEIPSPTGITLPPELAVQVLNALALLPCGQAADLYLTLHAYVQRQAVHHWGRG